VAILADDPARLILDDPLGLLVLSQFAAARARVALAIVQCVSALSTVRLYYPASAGRGSTET
jgi:hypothetical protein